MKQLLKDVRFARRFLKQPHSFLLLRIQWNEDIGYGIDICTIDAFDWQSSLFEVWYCDGKWSFDFLFLDYLRRWVQQYIEDTIYD